MEATENEFNIQEIEPIKIQGTDELLPPIPEPEPNEPTNQDQDQPKPKRKRGRPKKTETTNQETDKTDYSVVPVLFTNGAIFLISRFNLIENQPLTPDEEKVLRDSFAKAFPNIEASPKTLFFLTLCFILLSRLKFPTK